MHNPLFQKFGWQIMVMVLIKIRLLNADYSDPDAIRVGDDYY